MRDRRIEGPAGQGGVHPMPGISRAGHDVLRHDGCGLVDARHRAGGVGQDVIFDDLPSAIHWSFELLSCPIRAVNYDPDRIFGALTAAGNGYNAALDIKIAADRAARKTGAEDDRGNWILLSILPLDEPI